MSKFGDDIRRISRYEYLLKLINQNKSTADQSTKDDIGGSRGTAYGDGSTESGTPGVTPPNANGRPYLLNQPNSNSPGGAITNRGYQDGTNTGAHLTDGANKLGSPDTLTTGDNSAKDGWYDATSLIQKAPDSFGKSPPSPRDIVNTLTGLKTDDGTRDLIVHLNDAAYSFVPPIFATDAYDPGPDPLWESGKYWGVTNPGTAYDSTPGLAVAASIVVVQTAFPAPYPSGYGNAYWDEGSLTLAGAGDYTFVWYQGPGAPPVTSHVLQGACPGPGGTAAACAVSIAPSRSWTDLGVTQLGWVTPITPTLVSLGYNLMSKFVPNPFDVNVPTAFKDGASILDVKSLGGTDLRIGPLRDGGWYIYERDGSGNPVGASTDYSVYMVSGDRKAVGFTTPGNLNTLLP